MYLFQQRSYQLDVISQLTIYVNLATVCEHVDLVKHLVSEGADVMLKDNMGTTALDVAPSDEIKSLLKDSISAAH